jgi:ABC-type Zn2+ transport system substrate-binding protein/surface adhesin
MGRLSVEVLCGIDQWNRYPTSEAEREQVDAHRHTAGGEEEEDEAGEEQDQGDDRHWSSATFDAGVWLTL